RRRRAEDAPDGPLRRGRRRARLALPRRRRHDQRAAAQATPAADHREAEPDRPAAQADRRAQRPAAVPPAGRRGPAHPAAPDGPPVGDRRLAGPLEMDRAGDAGHRALHRLQGQGPVADQRRQHPVRRDPLPAEVIQVGSIIQYALIAGVLLIAIVFVRRQHGVRVQASKRLGFFLFLLLNIYAVARPDDVTWVAHRLGVGRGTDLLLYALIVTFVLAMLATYLRM